MRALRYALLVLPVAGGPSDVRNMANEKTTLVSRVTALIGKRQVARWKKWVGTVEWKRLDEEGRRIVISRMRAPKDAPAEVVLRKKMWSAWHALLLCGADPTTCGPSWILTGGTARRGPLMVGSVTPVDAITLPFYATSQELLAIRANEIGKEWATHGRLGDTWFEPWIEIDRLLSAGSLSDILGYALRSHSKAKCEPALDFSIPAFVRAAEGVIGLPRHMGNGPGFKDRALLLVPSLNTDPYVAGDAENLLLELYQLRNDCVHGKVPFLKLRSQGAAGEERAAKLQFVAETVAREALLVALRFPDQSQFATRDALEKAWSAGTFPASTPRSS